MTQDHKHSMLSDEQLESLLLDMRPSVPDEPLHPKVDDLTRRRVAGAVLAELEDMPRAQTRRRDVRKLSAVAAAAAASAAAVLIGLYALSEKPAQVVVSPVAGVALPDSDVENAFENVVPQSWFSLLHGEVNCGDKAVKLGSTVPMEKWIETRNGQSAFALPTGIAVGLADNSAVRVFWNGNRRYEVEVNQGMALFSVDPKRSREGFFVRTPQGILQVTGTLFTVVVEDEGDVSVHLHRGQLDIFSGSRKNEHMTAGHTALLRDEAVGVEPLQENADVANQMYKMGCIDAGQVFSELSNVDCSAGRTAVGRQGAKTGAEGAGRGTERSVPADKVTVEELLRRGSEARKAKQWSEAAAAYRTLIRLYPGSPDSRTALVTLAQLELQRLNEPQAALRHFSAYLKSPGALEQEALYGKAKAYRQTGDTSNELRTLKQLVINHPSGPIAKAAGQRISELSAPQR